MWHGVAEPSWICCRRCGLILKPRRFGVATGESTVWACSTCTIFSRFSCMGPVSLCTPCPGMPLVSPSATRWLVPFTMLTWTRQLGCLLRCACVFECSAFLDLILERGRGPSWHGHRGVRLGHLRVRPGGGALCTGSGGCTVHGLAVHDGHALGTETITSCMHKMHFVHLSFGRHPVHCARVRFAK